MPNGNYINALITKKEKQTRTITLYLLIDYESGQILIESNSGVNIGKMIDYFRELKPQKNSTIEL